MSIVKVSPKYQIVIPKEVRERLKIKPGQEIGWFWEEGNTISLVPLRPMQEFRESLRAGPPVPAFEREKVDRDPTGRYSYAQMVARAKRRRAS